MAERIVYLASTTFFCFVVSKMYLRTILLHAGKLMQVFFVLFYTVSPTVDAYSVRRQRTAKMAMLSLLYYYYTHNQDKQRIITKPKSDKAYILRC